MNGTYLEHFMNAARKITHAERCLAVGTDMKLHSTNIDQDTLEDPDFGNFIMDCLQEATRSGQAVITNNVITNPDDAPKTNRSFKDLRIVVAMPLPGHGAVYMDQLLSNTIIPKEKIDRLMHLHGYIQQNQLSPSTAAEITQLYYELELP